MPNIGDPFTLIYDRLVDIPKQSKGMQIVVAHIQDKVISHNTPQGHRAGLDEPKAANLPDIVVASSSPSGNLNFASNVCQINRIYQYLISTDVGALGDTIYPLEWALLCALVDANFEAQLNALAWHGYQFVKGVQLATVTSGESVADVNRGVQGWAAIWQINIQTAFPQSMMRQFNLGIEIIPEFI